MLSTSQDSDSLVIVATAGDAQTHLVYYEHWWSLQRDAQIFNWSRQTAELLAIWRNESRRSGARTLTSNMRLSNCTPSLWQHFESLSIFSCISLQPPRRCYFSFLAAFANGLGTMEIAAHENLAEDRYFRVSAVGLISLLPPPLLLLFSLIMHMIFFYFFLGEGGGGIEMVSCHHLNELRRGVLIERWKRWREIILWHTHKKSQNIVIIPVPRYNVCLHFRNQNKQERKRFRLVLFFFLKKSINKTELNFFFFLQKFTQNTEWKS